MTHLVSMEKGHRSSAFGTLPDLTYVSLHLAGFDLYPL